MDVKSPSIIAPAAATLVASVISAKASILDNLDLSVDVIIAPEPTELTSDKSVTLSPEISCKAVSALPPCAAVAKVDLSSIAAVPKPKVALAVPASTSSTKVAPKVLTLDPGKALSALIPCAAVA